MVDQAEIHRMAMSDDVEERREAAEQLRKNFVGLSDKNQAWDDLIRLTSDSDFDVRWHAAYALGIAFLHVPDKKHAWGDLHRLTSDNDSYVRGRTAYALDSAFSHVPDKNQAWDDLHRLTSDKFSDVRVGAAFVLSSAFSHMPDKNQAWDDLHHLISDDDSNVRIAANHSSGKVCIFRASEAENEDDFKNEMENAIGFFEKASKEATYFNPAKFCLPFYRSFYSLTFKKEEAEVQRYLSEAKSAVKGSKSKEKLLEAVENLGNVLKEVQKVQDFDSLKSNLNAYRRYCDHARALLDTMEEKAPSASRLIRKGLPIIDERIKGVIAEIQEKTEALCKQVNDTEYKEIGQQINNVGQELSKVIDSIRLDKAVSQMLIPLSAMCEKLTDEDRGEAFEILKQINDEQYIEDKLPLISNFLRKILNLISAYEFHEKAEQYKNDAKSEIGEKKVALMRVASENYSKASDQYEQGGILVNSYITKALSKSILVSTETDNIQALKDLEEAIIEINKAIKITDDIDVKQLRRLQGLKFEYLARKNIWFAIISSKDNTSNLDNILFDIVDCFKNASKMFEQDGNKDYVYKCKGCACLYESLSYLSKGIKTRKLKDFWTSYKSFEKSKEYYSSAKSVLGVNIIDKIGELIGLLKKVIDDYSECIEKGKTPKIVEWEKIFHKIDDILEEITVPGLKKLCMKYLWDETIANIDSIQERLSKKEELKKEENMGNIEIKNSNGILVSIGKDNYQVQDLNSPHKKFSKKPKKSTLPKKSVESAKANKNPKSPIPYLSELESEIADIFKSIYQKDRKPGISEVNSKTLGPLKHKLHDLKASGNDILWLDMGCGDGRCLEVLDDIQDRGNIYYHGIDISHKFLDDAEKCAKKYGIKSKIEAMNTAAMKFDSKFNLVSAILFLHEVDPLCLPYVIRNMLCALNDKGTLVILDFEGPYEQEEGVVSWGAEYLEKFLSNIGGAGMSIGFVSSEEFPKELGFYWCYVKKPGLDEKRFEKFIEGYSGFIKEKKEDSRKRREELRSQINKRVCEILKRPDIDTKNISDEEKALLRESMGEEYGIKALKIRLLTNEILFLDVKIDEFERGKRC